MLHYIHIHIANSIAICTCLQDISASKWWIVDEAINLYWLTRTIDFQRVVHQWLTTAQIDFSMGLSLANHAAALHGRKLGMVGDYGSHITCQISDDICIDILMDVVNSLYTAIVIFLNYSYMQSIKCQIYSYHAHKKFQGRKRLQFLWFYEIEL